MRQIKNLTQRLDHSVPEVMKRNNEGSETFKTAMQRFIDRRKKK